MPEERKASVVRRMQVIERRIARGPGFGSVFLGLLLLALGIGYLGQSMGWWSFAAPLAWWKFWPVVLIAVGLALLSDHGGAAALAGLVTVVVLALLFLALMGKGPIRMYESQYRMFESPEQFYYVP